MHMNVKGMKGRNYDKVLTWYKLILHNAQQLVNLLELERGDAKALGMTLNVIKCGLLSEDADVANLCARVLSKVCQIIHERAEMEEEAASLVPSIWEWFTQGQTLNLNSTLPQTKGQPGSAAKREKKMPKKQQELQGLLNEAGLRAYMRALRQHQGDFIEQFSASIVQFGTDNYVELFTHHLRAQSDGPLEFIRAMQESVGVLSQTARGRKALIDSGALNLLLEIGLEMSEAQG